MTTIGSRLITRAFAVALLVSLATGSCGGTRGAITGRVVTADGNGISGVYLESRFDGPGSGCTSITTVRNTTTDADGSYILYVRDDETEGTIMPKKTGYAFTPWQRTISSKDNNAIRDQDFVATASAESSVTQNGSINNSAVFTPVAVISIMISPSDPSIEKSASLQFTAMGTLTDPSLPAQDLTTMVVWSSSDSTLATIDEAGMATAHESGIAIIRASLGHLNTETTLMVK